MSLTEEQQAIRRTGVGASEIAGLVGMSPYVKPIDIFDRKVNGDHFAGNRHTERGEFFELPTAQWWAHRNGASLRTVGTLRHPKRPIIIATPDFIADLAGDELDLEVKVPGPRTWSQWGTPGTDEAPPMYVVQLQYTMAVTGHERGVIIAPIDGDLAEYPIRADAELQEMLMTAAEDFWREHVEPRRPPPPDASENYTAFLKRRFEEPRGPVRVADHEAELWARKLRIARREVAKWEEEEKLARQHLESIIGEADGVDGDGWSVRWSYVKGRAVIDYASLLADLSVPKETVERFTTRTPYRRFTCKFPEGEK